MSKHSKQALTQTVAGRLYDTDCFFFLSDKMVERAQQTAASIHARRVELDPKVGDFGLDAEMFAEPYIVHAVSIKTQDRVAIRTTDGKKHIFNADTPVMYAPNRDTFLSQLQWLAQQRHAMEKEQQRLQQARTSKKQQKEEELVLVSA